MLIFVCYQQNIRNWCYTSIVHNKKSKRSMRTFPFLFLLTLAFAFTNCNNAPAGEKAETGEAVETPAAENQATSDAAAYMVDTESSQINWIGAKLVGDQHTGFIKLSKGQLMVENDNLVGGSFVIDMTSLTDTDMAPGEGKEDLEGHLKDTDFFEVATYPTGEFEIASVAAVEGRDDATHNITGNLTLKGITKSITIPAKVAIDNNGVTAKTPQFTIDRTQWNVMYRAGVLGTAKDKIIKDEVALQIDLSAAPQQAVQ
jgi:polyisoprenoid-binding protein YceI